ncbi:unnamed protein product [Ceutorhynchus assimilis]|uniref:Uncharacterized protein n=1 Tax=Ceutorhynchus assimilis TaxID=467358 RepID=A0A9N9QAR6_9CUCU|nr:unnamed protein product [Ceutorhynchus assimilis]
MKNPKEMTALIEEISGSVTLKEEYEKLRKKMQEAQEAFNLAMRKKKPVVEKKEADKYSKIKDDLNKKLVEHQSSGGSSYKATEAGPHM